jgi:hypothetical protein
MKRPDWIPASAGMTKIKKRARVRADANAIPTP